MRSDLDSERESRLRRAMSFTSGKSSDGRGRKRSESSKSFLDSMKSLYATISKRASSPSKAGSSVGGSRYEAQFDFTGNYPTNIFIIFVQQQEEQGHQRVVRLLPAPWRGWRRRAAHDGAAVRATKASQE